MPNKQKKAVCQGYKKDSLKSNTNVKNSRHHQRPDTNFRSCKPSGFVGVSSLDVGISSGMGLSL